MLHIIFLIFGVYYFVRRLKLKDISSNHFPHADSEVFEHWKKLEMQSCELFIGATWGIAVVGFLVGLLVGALSIEMGAIIPFALVAAFLILLISSAVKGSKAAKIRKENGFALPKVIG